MKISNSIHLWLIWQIEELIETNIAMRKLSDENNGYMPFDHLLFFANFGNGDLLAFVILNGKIIKNDVFLWNHEDDSRQWVAPNLQQYFQWFFEGKITNH